jgi:poly(A) polymerase
MKKELHFQSKQLKNLIQIFHDQKIEIRIIGGSVRDALLGLPSKDIDLATSLKPEDVVTLLKAQNILTIPTGIKYGTITALIKGEHFEITTLRKDIKCDGRRAVVEFSQDFVEDAQRRDFTINALSYCPFTYTIFDYFDGLTHLKNRQVIFIGNPVDRIIEDHLRILRFFRFSTYYADEFNEAGLTACKITADLLANISRERINNEFDKILIAPNVLKTLDVISPLFLSKIFPAINLNIDLLAKILELKDELDLKISLDQIYGILFCLNKDINFQSLKFSNHSKKQIKQIINFISDTNVENALFCLKLLWINNADVDFFVALAHSLGHINLDIAKKLMAFFKNNTIPSFPISGSEIEKLGYLDKSIGNVLNYLKKIWILKNFNITKKELLTCLKNY